MLCYQRYVDDPPHNREKNMAEQALTPAPTVTKSDLALIKRTVAAAGATDEELHLFLYDCKRRGVHPLDKKLLFTKIGGRYTPITSIDFLLSQAAATGAYAGSDDTVFVEEDGRPHSATTTVYRIVQGHRCAFTATARFEEYLPRAGAPMWMKMPYAMLGKCSLALALRRGFPQETAGLYTSDEMQQAEPVYAAPATTTTTQPVLGSPVLGSPVLEEEPPPPDDPPDSMMFEEAAVTRPMSRPARQGNGQDTRVISEKQAKRLFAITANAGRLHDDVDAYIKATFGYDSRAQIQRSDYEAICDFAAGQVI